MILGIEERVRPIVSSHVASHVSSAVDSDENDYECDVASESM